jgi:hypothetical protein
VFDIEKGIASAESPVKRSSQRELVLLQGSKLDHDKAATLHGLMITNADRWQLFVSDSLMPPNNNFA